jgi:hypothetical protein
MTPTTPTTHLTSYGEPACYACKEIFADARGCSFHAVVYDDESSDARLPHDGPERCADCGSWPGHWHHYGCALEACPHCLGRLLECGRGEYDVARYGPDPSYPTTPAPPRPQGTYRSTAPLGSLLAADVAGSLAPAARWKTP